MTKRPYPLAMYIPKDLKRSLGQYYWEMQRYIDRWKSCRDFNDFHHSYDDMMTYARTELGPNEVNMLIDVYTVINELSAPDNDIINYIDV